jgi:hypothetical protein
VYTATSTESSSCYPKPEDEPEMPSKARFSRAIEGQERVIDVHYDQLRDRAEVFVDGRKVGVRTVRRAFSGLWRFQFHVGDEPLEVRVQYGLAEPTFELGPQGEAVAKRSFGWKIYAATAFFSTLMLIALRPPPVLAAALFVMCTFVTGGLISFVYGRN